MIQYGMDDEVLGSSTIWLCASCETCTTRCPNEVDVAHLMDTLRQMALKRDIPAKEKDVPAFHEAFLRTVRMGGRVYELGMIGLYKLKTFSFFKDMRLGREMFNRGKLKVLPDMIKGRKEIKKIFKDAKRGN
jgi:heterodisulfide reductase subunit C